MVKVSPEFLFDEQNKKRGVLLSVKDFERLMESLENFYDYLIIKKREKEKTVSFEEIKKKYSRK